MIIYEDKFLILLLDENNILIARIKPDYENNSSYICSSIDKMIEGIGNTYQSFYKLNNKLGLIFDTRELRNILPLSCVWNIAKFFSGIKDLTEEIAVGSSVITANDTIISLVNAFSKLYQNVKPMKFCKDYDEGCDFIKELFKNSKILTVNVNDNNNIDNDNIDNDNIDNLIDKYTNQ